MDEGRNQRSRFSTAEKRAIFFYKAEGSGVDQADVRSDNVAGSPRLYKTTAFAVSVLGGISKLDTSLEQRHAAGIFLHVGGMLRVRR